MRQAGISYQMLLPVLLAGILLVPFTMNFFSHLMFAEKKSVNTLVMKLPLDNSVVTVPSEVLQFEDFEVSLQFATKDLASRINDIVSTASEGATIQGIVGVHVECLLILLLRGRTHSHFCNLMIISFVLDI